ncbi:hypothetical protein [Massilia sp. TS11]|uniref:hypothetical protein n=1 Tax=Massilia sp. TS11 TaxID=2908003 RepID=UPI001EDACB66|nr:hypothetical protein [Massilia sp. TS11]MCG2583157.1 hypothetical protein [Massilia sp. TS11]
MSSEKHYPFFRPLVAFRLKWLERHAFIHLSIAVLALGIGLISHFTEHGSAITLGAIAFAVLAEIMVLVGDVRALSKPRLDHIEVRDAFGDIFERIEEGASASEDQGRVLRQLVKQTPDNKIRAAAITYPQTNAQIRERALGEGTTPLVNEGDLDPHVVRNCSQFLREALDGKISQLASRHSPVFFNQQKISLLSDLDGGVPNVVCVGQVSYVASTLTNDFCTKRLVRHDKHRGVEWPYFDLTPMFPVRTGDDGIERLMGLRESGLANHVGISTLALIRHADGQFRLQLHVQSARADKGANLIVPSGSGSLDWSDHVKTGLSDFFDITSYGATREFLEENRYLPEDGGHKAIASLIEKMGIETLPIGYFRWLDHGGKPEFSHVTLVEDGAFNHVRNNLNVPEIEAAARTYSFKTIDELKAICASLVGATTSTQVVCATRADCSMPLLMNALLLHEGLSQPDSKLVKKIAAFLAPRA